MTDLLEPPLAATPPPPARPVAVPGPIAKMSPARLTPAPPSPARQRRKVLVWIFAVVAGAGSVAYGFGPLFQAREQRRLTARQIEQVDQAANQVSGLRQDAGMVKPPAEGSPVAILEIGAVRLQQAVVEGVSSSRTRQGPGHVPGTAGLGQPGNSVIVGRAHGFGGPFGRLDRLRKGDRVLVTTTQGQSVYEVTEVRRDSIRPAPADGGRAEPSDDGKGITLDELYGPSKDDRLTLVTSASGAPWNRTRARVVVAALQGTPFAPTPQNGRSDTQTGQHGDTGASAAVLVAMVVYGAALGGGVLLYQRFRLATAYILATCPVLASTIIAGETLSRVFPAWL